MKRFLFLLLVPFSVFANPIDEMCPQFVLRGAPVSQITSTIYLCKQNYAINYRTDTKTAEYVVEHPTREAVTGPSKRKDDFRPDPSVPVQFQSQLADYAGHPYDRGHLVPAGDSTQTAAIMSESFFLSNMMPQNPGNNRGIWKYLEEQTRAIAQKQGDVFVITGTVYDGAVIARIGNVEVPTHIYKIIIDPRTGRTLAHLFPNIKLDVADLDRYAVTVADIEKVTGIDFSPRIPANLKVKETQRTLLKDW